MFFVWLNYGNSIALILKPEFAFSEPVLFLFHHKLFLLHLLVDIVFRRKSTYAAAFCYLIDGHLILLFVCKVSYTRLCLRTVRKFMSKLQFSVFTKGQSPFRRLRKLILLPNSANESISSRY